MSTGNAEVSRPMCASLEEACRSQSKRCFQRRYMKAASGGRPYTCTTRLSNCEEMMCSQPANSEYVRKMFPTTGLCNGYGSLHGAWPSCPGIARKRLVKKEHLWPKWEPYRWVFDK